MALKSWMQSNGVFDKELLSIFPQYQINDPSTDLKNLTAQQWKEIKSQQLRNRASEIKNAGARKRLEAKFTKIEKLWKASRAKPKKKKKKHKKSKTQKLEQFIPSIPEQKAKEEMSIKASAATLKTLKTRETPRTPMMSKLEIENLKHENNRLSNENKELILEFNLFKKMHKTKMDNLQSKYETQNEEWQKKYGVKEVEFREMQKVYNKYKQMNFTTNNKKISLTEQNKSLSADIQRLNDTIDGLKGEKDTFESKQSKLREDMTQYKEYNNLLKQNLSEMEKMNEISQEKITTFENTISKTISELNESNNQKLIEKNMEIERLKQSESTVVSELRMEKNRETKALQTQISALEEQVSDARNDWRDTQLYKGMRADNEELKGALQTTKKRYEILNELHESYDIAEVIAENKSLKAKLRARKKTAVLEDVLDTIMMAEEEDMTQAMDTLKQERDSLKMLVTHQKGLIEQNSKELTLRKEKKREKKERKEKKDRKKKEKSKKLKKKEKMFLPNNTETYITAFD